MDNQEKIGNQTLNEIKKAFHLKKLPDLLNKMLANGEINDETTKELKEFLEAEQKIADKLVNEVKEVLKDKTIFSIDNKPPSVDELMSGINWTKEEEEKTLKVLNYIETELANIRLKIAKKVNIQNSYWLDTATTFLSYEPLLSRYYIYKSQLYHAKITNIIDDVGCTRLEAENRAKLTKEYADYKMLQRIIGDLNLTGLIERFENLSKKYDAK